MTVADRPGGGQGKEARPDPGIGGYGRWAAEYWRLKQHPALSPLLAGRNLEGIPSDPRTD